MSDDEGDAGNYDGEPDDFGVSDDDARSGAPSEEEAATPRPRGEADEDEDDEGDGDEGDGENLEAEPDDDEAAAAWDRGKKADPLRPRVDPLLHASNKSRRVHVLTGDDRLTSEMMTQAEYARCLGVRAAAIDKGEPIFIDVTGLRDPVEIADAELRARRCPLTVRREISVGRDGVRLVDDWSANEMVLPPAANVNLGRARHGV